LRISLNQRCLCLLLFSLALASCGSGTAPVAGGDEASPPARETTTAAEAAPSAKQITPEQAQEFERRQQALSASEPAGDWTPTLTATDPAAVADTLERATAALAAGEIDRGAAPALTLYLSVLESEPANADAKAGLQAIALLLMQRGRDALADNRFEDAAALLPVLKRIAHASDEYKDYLIEVERGRRVALLLLEAQQHEAAGRVLAGDGRDAATAYRDVLQIDPAHPLASEALNRIEAELVARATAAAEGGDYAGSDRLLADAAKVQPGSAGVQDASTRIVALRQHRAGELLAQAQDAARAGELPRAESLLADLERVSAQSQGIDELRASIENARLYGGFHALDTFSDLLDDGGRGPEMSVIPVGRFEMGSARAEAGHKRSESPRHEVVFARGFALARAETTVAQYRAFVDATGYVTHAQQVGRSTVYDESTGSMVERRAVTWRHDHAGEDAADNLPVAHLAWRDALAFADWLTRQTGKDYRLPTEAEFEYVLRDGSAERYPWGDGLPTRVLGNLTGDGDRSASKRNWSNAFPTYTDGYWGPAPVRSFEPNRAGVHDMVGNLSEWVEDCWHDSYQRAPDDGSAWINPGCNRRVVRGSSWASSPEQVRSAYRIKTEPDTTNPRLGFRVARNLTLDAQPEQQ
jgi:formylglycine-generating enzyme required for sulfatase activity